MIRPRDALTLAHTKLRTHRVRTGISLAVASMLFGLLFGGVFVAQGIFESVDDFSEEGLADRSIVTVMKFNDTYFDSFQHASDPAFIAEVRQAHLDFVALKTAAAKKHGVQYDPATEDPSPIEIDSLSGKERVSDQAFGSSYVQVIVEKKSSELYEPLDIAAFLAPYRTATVLEGNRQIQPASGVLLPIEDGKEKLTENDQGMMMYPGGGGPDMVSIHVLNQSIADPFIMRSSDSVQGDEIPAVVSFGYAEKLLGLEALPSSSSNEQRIERLDEVRRRIDEVTASFCYRNQASQALHASATTQQEMIKKNKNTTGYVEPSVLYELPPDGTCGAVAVVKDSRSQAEKQSAANYEAYLKEIGQYEGDPFQHKITFRAIGLSGDMQMGVSGAASDLVMSLLGSWLYYGPTWSIPADALAAVPEDVRPAELFSPVEAGQAADRAWDSDSYIVEFADKNEARAALQRNDPASATMVTPYGSGTLVVDQFRQWFLVALLWALAIVGGVAMIIMAGLIGRMVSDGRRESAVFRAIGARRVDIASIYGVYALLLSVRVALFALLGGLALALGIELWLSSDATLSARLAYAAIDTNKEFHFIGIGSWYVPAMLGVIVLTGLIASIAPILLGVRRNPINDMRDDT